MPSPGPREIQDRVTRKYKAPYVVGDPTPALFHRSTMTSQTRIHGLEQRVALLEAMLGETTRQIAELIRVSNEKTDRVERLIDVVDELRRAIK